jgi:diadenosine tetraphosphatase ApaH/serine/threonine PP2A family protein phosphatase
MLQLENGPTPGKRYGHSLVYYKPFFILFGGNLNNEVANDVWILNSEQQPLRWTKLDIKGELPLPRIYHSSVVCTYGGANGMMVVFGGRKKNGQNLNDMWGLRKHRNGLWDWMKAPYKGSPQDRIQHTSLFCGNFFINIGGRSQTLGDNLPIEVYDTENSEWSKFCSFRRFRHSSFIFENFLYIHGGLEDDKHNNPANILNEIDLFELFASNQNLTTKLKIYFAKKLEQSTKNPNEDKTQSNTGSINNDNTALINSTSKDIKIADKFVIGGKFSQSVEFSDLVRYCSMEKLNNEHVSKENMMKMLKNKALNYSLEDKVIMALLRPKEWVNRPLDEEDSTFCLDVETVIALIEQCGKIVQEQPMVLKVEAPVKVFGDIHGQYQDLMRFFDLFSAPIQGPGGDIDGLDYIFLGDYVDRGTHSLETICLLMALKIKFPNQVHLLRGNHEDRWINSAFGFQQELIDRLKDDSDNPVIFTKFNDFFDYLPLAAIINDEVLCLHGGIGSSINSLSDIEKIHRPLEVIHEVSNNDQQLVVDILWSDPTDSDIETGIQPNSTRDPTGVGNIVKFGPDRVDEFLKNNNLTLILRAHECVMDGFERFAGGNLITVFSATDYCGKHKNAGAILILGKDFKINPKLIYPQECPNKNWDNGEEALKLRPPTPPRNRQGSANDLGKKNSFS